MPIIFSNKFKDFEIPQISEIITNDIPIASIYQFVREVKGRPITNRETLIYL